MACQENLQLLDRPTSVVRATGDNRPASYRASLARRVLSRASVRVLFYIVGSASLALKVSAVASKLTFAGNGE